MLNLDKRERGKKGIERKREREMFSFTIKIVLRTITIVPAIALDRISIAAQVKKMC
jgi:hypothetical protein